MFCFSFSLSPSLSRVVCHAGIQHSVTMFSISKYWKIEKKGGEKITKELKEKSGLMEKQIDDSMKWTIEQMSEWMAEWHIAIITCITIPKTITTKTKTTTTTKKEEIKC